MSAHQRPKLEDYDDGYFLVLHTARYLDDIEEVEFGEVHVFTGDGFVIVVRHGAASELHSARERLEAPARAAARGPAAAVWAIMDKVVDDYEPVMAGLENDVEEVEVDVFGERGDETKRIYFLRRELAEFYRAVHPLLAAARAARVAPTRGALDAGCASTCATSSDHVKRVEEAIVDPARAADERPAGQPRRHLPCSRTTSSSKISGWAAIITVPTLIASIYGMNFEHMPELQWTIGYPLALTMMVVAGLVPVPPPAPRRLAVARSRDGTPGKPSSWSRALLLALGLAASLLAGRLRIPGLVLFLGVGMLVGSDGLGLIEFNDYELARTIGIIALALILFEGGLAAGYSEIRPVLGSALSLATLGTLHHRDGHRARRPLAARPDRCCRACSSARSCPRPTARRSSRCCAARRSSAASRARSRARPA